MRKIASPQELQTEIKGVLAYIQETPRPERARIARALASLAERVAADRDIDPLFAKVETALSNLIKAVDEKVDDITEAGDKPDALGQVQRPLEEARKSIAWCRKHVRG